MSREFPLGFGAPEPVAPGLSAVATFLTGKQHLRYVQIVLPSTFELVDFWINGESQMLSDQPVSGFAFYGLRMRGQEIAPETIVELEARNISGDVAMMSGALLCEVLPPAPSTDVARPPVRAAEVLPDGAATAATIVEVPPEGSA